MSQYWCRLWIGAISQQAIICRDFHEILSKGQMWHKEQSEIFQDVQDHTLNSEIF